MGRAQTVAALWLAAFLAYSNSFGAALVLDSNGVILQDSRVTAVTADNVRKILTGEYWPGSTQSGLYRPITKLTYLFDYAVLGSRADPVSYHWINFLLHGVNMTLAFYLGLELFAATRPALLLAALWGLHPALTESVTNVVGRADLLAGLAVLAGLLCHVRAREKKWPWLAVLAAVATIGVFSKESAVVLLAAMALYDFTWGKPNWPAYACAAIPFGGFLAARTYALHGAGAVHAAFTDNPLAYVSFWEARLTAVKVIGRYLLLLVWPARLSCDYSYNEVPVSGWGDFAVLLSLAVCAGIIVAAFYHRRRHPLPFFFAAFFFAALLPSSSLVVMIGSIMAERFLYLPALGFAGCVVYLLRGHARWALAAACVLFAVRTYTRNQDWRDEASLWASAVHAAPNSYKVHMAAAGGLPMRAAQTELERALAILEPLPDAHNLPIAYVNAGALFRDLGDAAPPAQRETWYRKSLETLQRGERIRAATGAAGWYQLYEELGETYRKVGDPDRAAISILQGQIAAPWNGSLKAELANVMRTADGAHVCSLARALTPPQSLGCP
jgi:hypothetical protein